MKKSQRSLKAWTDQKWRTKSGKPSLKTGERYLPEKAIKALSDEEYRRTTRAKRAAMRKGKQVSKQPKSISKKTASYRKFSQEIDMAVDKKAIAAMGRKKKAKMPKASTKDLKALEVAGASDDLKQKLFGGKSINSKKAFEIYMRYRKNGLSPLEAYQDVFDISVTDKQFILK